MGRADRVAVWMITPTRRWASAIVAGARPSTASSIARASDWPSIRFIANHSSPHAVIPAS